MNWISILFFYVLVTTLTGTAMLAIWSLCRLLLIKWNPNLIYYMLRWVVVMFLVPVTGCTIFATYRDGYIRQEDNDLSFLMIGEAFPYQLLLFVWLIVMVVNTVRYLVKSVKRYQLFKGNIEEDDPLAQTEFERIKKILEIKGKITLLRNDQLEGPLITGIFRRKVILPYLKYEEDELKSIFYHELMHFKKHDLVFKKISILIEIIQGMNPVVYLLSHVLDTWSECDCDCKAIVYLEKEGIDDKSFYNIIWSMIDDEGKTNRDIYTFSMFFGDKTDLERRMRFVNKYTKKVKKVSKVVTAVLVLCFAMASTVTSYAAGVGISKINDVVLKEMQVIDTNNEFAEDTGTWSDEFEVTAEESQGVEIIYMDSEIMPLSGESFDWSVPSGVRIVSSMIYLSKGSQITIVCTAQPNNKLYWYGLQKPSGNCTVCEGTGAGNHTFTAETSGFYRVMVENRSDTDIRAIGGYTY